MIIKKTSELHLIRILFLYKAFYQLEILSKINSHKFKKLIIGFYNDRNI